MTFYLPTISSLNRQINITLRPRRERREISQTCPHSGIYNLGSGRCPICYRQRIQSYGNRIRRSAPLPILRRPRPPQPVRTNPFTRNNFLFRTGIRPQRTLPGKCVDIKNKELVCSICYCNYNSNMDCQVLPCTHKFHSTCLKKWFQKKQNCPLCRRHYGGMPHMP